MPDEVDRTVGVAEQTPAQRRADTAGVAYPTSEENRAARWAGWFMALTFITSIPALLLYHSILHHDDFILGADSVGSVEFAAFLEVLLAIGGIGVAVVMFPILKRQSERMALGYVASRIVESTMICVGVIALLSILTLRDDLAASIGGDSGSLVIAGRTLVAIHDGTFLMGPGFCVGVNDLLLGYLMYTTGLMPRATRDGRPRRRPVDLRREDPGGVRRLRRLQQHSRPLRDPGLHLRGVVCDLPDLEGVPAVSRSLRRASRYDIYLIVKGFRPCLARGVKRERATERVSGRLSRPPAPCA